jgi:energy-coupling factor transport system permease protein
LTVKLPAWIKLLLMAALSVLIVALPGPWLLPLAVAVAVFIIALGASPAVLLRMFTPALPFIAAICIFQAVLQGNGDVIASIWLIEVTRGGIDAAFISALRMVLLYLIGSAVTATTGEHEITHTIERALRPLDHITGLSLGKDISTMMALALTFIPIISEEYRSIKMAQQARGVRYGAFQGLFSVAMPLLYSISERADDVALAMEARCYGYKK